MKPMLLRRSSVFPAEADTIWQHLQQLSTLQHVAKPYAAFVPVDSAQPLQWAQGASFSFHFKVFGFLPLGIHTIHVQEMNAVTRTIFTHESNAHVPVWNHRILLRPLNETNTSYTDEVEIFAGWKTPLVFLWAQLFYGHRQRKWRAWLSQ